MIKHLVLLRFHEGFDTHSPKALQMHQAMQALGSTVPEVRQWQCGFNVLPDAQAADYALCASFDDRQALFSYFDHPAHLEVLTLCNEIAELQFVDLEH